MEKRGDLIWQNFGWGERGKAYLVNSVLQQWRTGPELLAGLAEIRLGPSTVAEWALGGGGGG